MALSPDVVVVAPGELITSAHINNIRANLIRIDDAARARGVVGYAQAVADQASITTESALANMSASFTAVAGRRYKVTAQVEPRSTVAGDAVWAYLRDGVGGTILKNAKLRTGAVGIGESLTLGWVSTASISGAKTYQISLARITGTGTITNGAAANDPSFIVVEDVGAL